MDQKIVNMIENSGIEVSDVEHIIKAVESQTKQSIAQGLVITDCDGNSVDFNWCEGVAELVGRVAVDDMHRQVVNSLVNEFDFGHYGNTNLNLVSDLEGWAIKKDEPVNNKVGFIATAQFDDEEISYFGEGDTPEEALSYFNLDEHISEIECENGDEVEIGIFKAIYKGSEEWNKGDYRDEFQWVLGDRVATKFVEVVLEDESNA
jgi:hypothetical protein